MNIRLLPSHDNFPRPLRASLWDVIFCSLMVGLGESYLGAFVLTLGVSEGVSGLLVTMPILIGSVFQLFAGFLAKLFGSQKAWVMACAFTQGSVLILFALMSRGFTLASLSAETTALILLSAYWTSALVATPSWSSWIGSIVPNNRRTFFFAYRLRVAQLFTVLGLCIAGFALESRSSLPDKLNIFALMFLTSALCRYICVACLGKHPESLVRPTVDVRALFKKQFWNWLGERRTLTIIAFLFLTQVATNVSGPFFNAYLLKQLSLDYHDYMILISTAFIARVVAGGVLQKMAHRLGPTTLTHLGSLMIVPLPLLWTTTNHFPLLVVFQTLTGLAWGCHELGVTLLLLDKHSHRERISLLTITQLSNATAMFLGSWAGYVLLGADPAPVDYDRVFVLSTLLRLLPVLILARLGDSGLRGLLLPSRIFSR